MNWLDNLNIEDLPEPYSEMAELIGIENALKIAEHFGKQQIYFKSLKEIIAERKRQYIVENFNGVNHAELARVTDYSVQYVYEILAKERNKRQRGLFSNID
ncbi:hypothetical protein A45J_0389 [hot springs metagenome]|uniref:Mor transcription activator domain-containing protein n=1 Tax=hot springs metagenome TaxID=433727 RepID=A0A5J4L1L4_9ZZZZ